MKKHRKPHEVLREIEVKNPDFSHFHKSLIENSHHNGEPEPLKGALMEAGLLIDGHDTRNIDAYHENFGDIHPKKKELGDYSYKSLINMLIPFLLEGHGLNDEDLDFLHKNKKRHKEHVLQAIPGADFMKLSPEMVANTGNHHKNHKDALYHIIESMVHGTI